MENYRNESELSGIRCWLLPQEVQLLAGDLTKLAATHADVGHHVVAERLRERVRHLELAVMLGRWPSAGGQE